MENQKENITAEVNENAYDTWLEPYVFGLGEVAEPEAKLEYKT